VTEIMRSIHPLSRRIEGIRNDSAITMAPLPIERITAPTLVISARDDLYNTLPAAEHLAKHIPGASLIVLDNGGHLMVGRGRRHDCRVSQAIGDGRRQRQPYPSVWGEASGADGSLGLAGRSMENARHHSRLGDGRGASTGR
jgi:hypothetical protein